MKKKTPLLPNPNTALGEFIKEQRKKLHLNQEDLALRSGIGLRLIRDIEQGRERKFRIDTVNQILQIFGYKLKPTPIEDDRD